MTHPLLSLRSYFPSKIPWLILGVSLPLRIPRQLTLPHSPSIDSLTSSSDGSQSILKSALSRPFNILSRLGWSKSNLATAAPKGSASPIRSKADQKEVDLNCCNSDPKEVNLNGNSDPKEVSLVNCDPKEVSLVNCDPKEVGN